MGGQIIGPEGTKTVDFPDTDISGRVLAENALTLVYTPGHYEDGILFGIAVEDAEQVVQFNVEHAVKLHTLLGRIIEESS